MRMYNVVMLGFSFMFMFTAFQTTSMIEVRVLLVDLMVNKR